MKKNKTKRKVIRLLRKIILVAITIFAFLMWWASLGELVKASPKGFVIFTVSAAWLIAFGYANGWNKDLPKEKSAEIEIIVMHSNKKPIEVYQEMKC